MGHQTDKPTRSSPTTLVVNVGGIGDFLLCCPALLKLSSTGPLELLGNPNRLKLGMAAGLARAVHDINHVGFESVFNQPSDRFQKFTRAFKRAIIWMKDQGGQIRQGFRQCGLQKIEVFPGLPPADWKDHASIYYLQCLGFKEASPWHFQVKPAPCFYDIIIHPGSGGKFKNWPQEHYLDLARSLKKRGRLVTWCLGPAEDDFFPGGDERAIRLDSLSELSRLLGSARLFIGNDSGITHLAAAVGCPTIAIYGPTNPRLWAPLGQHVTIIQGNPWPQPEEVMSAILFKEDLFSRG